VSGVAAAGVVCFLVCIGLYAAAVSSPATLPMWLPAIPVSFGAAALPR